MSRELETLTVGELIAQLEKFPKDKPVVFAYPSGDHWHTVIAGPINDLNHGAAKYTSYHDGFKIVEEDEDRVKDEDAVGEVVILN